LRIKANEAYKLNVTLSKAKIDRSIIAKERDSEIRHFQDFKGNIDWFRESLLGASGNSLIKIVNENQIRFRRDGEQLTISSKEPLEIENMLRGYKIYYFLQPFVAKQKTIDQEGIIKFESLYADDYEQQNTWLSNRFSVFHGTGQHLFRTIIDGNSEEQGFKLFDDKNELLNVDSLIKPSKIPGYHNIDLPEHTKVVYNINSLPKGNQANDTGNEISWISKHGSVDVSNYGILLSSGSIEIEGAFSRQGLATMLPINYLPVTSADNDKQDWQNFALLQEKVYLHTDRDYYYPRETIWFKAYLAFAMPTLRDTLSRLLYVELLDPQGNILSTKNVKIRNGVGWGQFKLPAILDKGEYYLCAYTNWMRNYKEELYTKPLPILAHNENLIESSSSQQNEVSKYRVNVISEKKTFAPREKVELSFEVFDKAGNSIPSNLSISVVDNNASVSLPDVPNLLSDNLLHVEVSEDKSHYFDSITYLMERGLTITGDVINYRGRKVVANLDIIQGNMDNLISMPTNKNGEFIVSGLDFGDSIYFAIKATDLKGKTISKAKLTKITQPPAFSYNKPKLKLAYQPYDALQRIQNTFDLNDTRLLEEVVIKGKPIKEQENKLMFKLYGEPDYVIKGSEMYFDAGLSNPLVGLQGLVPGLRITEYYDGFGLRQTRVTTRGATSTFGNNSNPLIIVDGMIWSPDQLKGLSSSRIDYVEVITRATVMYGSRGANGIIAFYTKQSADFVDSKVDYSFHQVKGYSRPIKFSDPDYSNENVTEIPDFRTTIHWAPSVTSEKGKPAIISFYSADLETRYRIVVEGITNEGVPLRAVTYINIVR
jgi:hypothetical protein